MVFRIRDKSLFWTKSGWKNTWEPKILNMPKPINSANTQYVTCRFDHHSFLRIVQAYRNISRTCKQYLYGDSTAEQFLILELRNQFKLPFYCETPVQLIKDGAERRFADQIDRDFELVSHNYHPVQLFTYELHNKYIRGQNQTVQTHEKGEQTFDQVFCQEVQYIFNKKENKFKKKKKNQVQEKNFHLIKSLTFSLKYLDLLVDFQDKKLEPVTNKDSSMTSCKSVDPFQTRTRQATPIDLQLDLNISFPSSALAAIIIFHLNYMNDYGSSNSRSRPTMKSPNPHTIDDLKTIKKKYEQGRDALKVQRKNAQTLEGTVRALRDQTMKQQRQLMKKDEQIDILLQQIKYLKNVIADNKSKQNSKIASSYEEQASVKSSKEISSYEEQVSSKNDEESKQPAVGGYFGSIFK